MDDDRREIEIEPSFPAIEDVRRVDVGEVLGGAEPGAGGKAKGAGRLPKERNVKSKRKKRDQAAAPALDAVDATPAESPSADSVAAEVVAAEIVAADAVPFDTVPAEETVPADAAVPAEEVLADDESAEQAGGAHEVPMSVALIDELASAPDLPSEDTQLDRLEDRQLLAALFGSPEELSVARLAEILGWRRKAVEQRLPRVQKWLDQLLLPFELRLIAGGWRLVSRSEYAELLGRLRVVRRRDRLSQAALEVLSVVAYKQPVPAGEVDRIRGVSCSSILRLLLDRELVTVVGRADTPGRPLLYVTTKVFLDRFGLGALHDLPGIEVAQDGYAPTADDEALAEVDAEAEVQVLAEPDPFERDEAERNLREADEDQPDEDQPAAGDALSSAAAVEASGVLDGGDSSNRTESSDSTETADASEASTGFAAAGPVPDPAQEISPEPPAAKPKKRRRR